MKPNRFFLNKTSDGKYRLACECGNYEFVPEDGNYKTFEYWRNNSDGKFLGCCKKCNSPVQEIFQVPNPA